MISIQTNVTSLIAQQNLNVNTQFESKTIQQLTSGYRINSSGDDAAGLAVANQYRADIAQLTQGVQNANNGVSTLQIIDGGLNNISHILDRLQTLASESASATFQGDRTTLNNEYQTQLQEITRQANNIGLAAGGKFNTVNSVFIGGGNSAANGVVSVDLSGPQNQVDAAGLGLATSSVGAGGTALTGNTQRLDAPGATFVSATAQVFTFNLYSSNGGAQTVTASVGGSGALTATQVLASLNGTLNPYGISAAIGSDGKLAFGGSTPFAVTVANTAIADAVVTPSSSAINTGVYQTDGETFAAKAETLTLQNGQGTATVTLALTDTIDSAIAKINSKTAAIGIYAVKDAASGISFQSANSFTASTDTAAGVFTSSGAQTIVAPDTTGTVTGNAVASMSSIKSAIAALGLVQGRVGTGENQLQYAISLAQSQISSFSGAESGIRDADVAQEASNLTKAQVLQQSSVAALVQANAISQAVLALLKNA